MLSKHFFCWYFPLDPGGRCARGKKENQKKWDSVGLSPYADVSTDGKREKESNRALKLFHFFLFRFTFVVQNQVHPSGPHFRTSESMPHWLPLPCTGTHVRLGGSGDDWCTKGEREKERFWFDLLSAPRPPSPLLPGPLRVDPSRTVLSLHLPEGLGDLEGVFDNRKRRQRVLPAALLFIDCECVSA